MQRIDIAERIDWRERAAECGFDFHTIGAQPYWNERAYYSFSLRQIEDDIEDPTAELHAMAMDLIDDILRDEATLRQLDIPDAYWSWIAQSWQHREPHVYGRMDLAYDGVGPAKLYELNYDTPTSLLESAFFQWQWLEDQIQRGQLPPDADQFNSIYESLVERFATVGSQWHAPLYFAAIGDSAEDAGTIGYLRDCAKQAGLDTASIAMEDLGISADARFTDLHDRVIRSLCKLYPLEDMFRERFGGYLPRAGMQLIEPPWKALLSNKGILPLLWQRHPGHPNLLPAAFDDGSTLPAGWVRKPLHSREGANIAMHLPDGAQLATAGPYTQRPCIRQAYHPLPRFNDRHVLVGSWVVGDKACGMGLREDASAITRDSAHFLPHAIIDGPRTTFAA